MGCETKVSTSAFGERKRRGVRDDAKRILGRGSSLLLDRMFMLSQPRPRRIIYIVFIRICDFSFNHAEIIHERDDHGKVISFCVSLFTFR